VRKLAGDSGRSSRGCVNRFLEEKFAAGSVRLLLMHFSSDRREETARRLEEGLNDIRPGSFLNRMVENLKKLHTS